MIKYISIFRLVLRRLLVAREENLTGFSTGLTGRSKNLDPTATRPAGRPDQFPSLSWVMSFSLAKSFGTVVNAPRIKKRRNFLVNRKKILNHSFERVRIFFHADI